MKIEGDLDLHGNLVGNHDRLQVKGNLTVQKNVMGNINIIADGNVEIKGDVMGQSISIKT